MKNAKTDIKHGPETAHTEATGPHSTPLLNQQVLAEENGTFAGTGGVSQENAVHGFVPGYLDTQSGEMAVSCFADGQPAPIHILEGLPDGWIQQRSASGQVLQVKEGVIAGFILNGRFYTRKQAAKTLARIH